MNLIRQLLETINDIPEYINDKLTCQHVERQNDISQRLSYAYTKGKRFICKYSPRYELRHITTSGVVLNICEINEKKYAKNHIIFY